MEKRAIIIILSILMINLCYNVNALVGVTPSSYEIDFQPNTKQKFRFDFIFDPGVEAEISVGGDLDKYVKLDRDYLVGGGRVIATLNLPSEIEVPGTHLLGISAKQIAKEEAGIRLIGHVIGVIKVKVPYPGKYAEIELYTTNANAGEAIEFTVLVRNLGKEDITANAVVEIYDKKDNYIGTVNLGNMFIKSPGTKQFQVKHDTSNYQSGDYKAKAIVNYGGKSAAEAEGSFRLGTLYVGISNYTKKFEENKLNKLDIEAESFWNDPIDVLYANVTLPDYNISFITPSMNIQPWSKQKLTGYFDTTPIKKSKFKANITLHYRGETTSEVVDLRFRKETDYRLYTIAGGVVIVFIILVFIIILLLIRMKNANKKK